MISDRTDWPDSRLDDLAGEVRGLRSDRKITTAQIATIASDLGHLKDDVSAIRKAAEGTGKNRLMMWGYALGAAAVVLASLITMVGTLAGH